MARVFDEDKLKIDCENCDALCCVAYQLPYPDYPKPARVACKHLDDTQCRCTIFSELDQRGYSLCRKYDCRGAGPAVTRLFRGMGRSWIKNPEIANAELHTFAAVYHALIKDRHPEATPEFNVPDKLRADLKPFVDAALDFLAKDSSDPGEQA